MLERMNPSCPILAVLMIFVEEMEIIRKNIDSGKIYVKSISTLLFRGYNVVVYVPSQLFLKEWAIDVVMRHMVVGRAVILLPRDRSLIMEKTIDLDREGLGYFQET